MRNTGDQQRAIDARGRHLLLAAAAGSGKTYTLVERILALLSEGAELSQMLIITFTRAAAADMKAKLIGALSERAEQSERLQEQLRQVEYANIQTIDSFCAEVVRNHFEAAGADPLYHTPDDAVYRQLMARALESALEQAYEENSDDLRALHFGRGAAVAGELAQALHWFAENRPDPEDWLHRALIELPAGDGGLWFDELKMWAQRELWDLSKMAKSALLTCGLPGGPAAYTEAIQADIDQIEHMLGEDDYDGIASELMAFTQARVNPIRKSDHVDEQLKKRVSGLRKAWKDGIAKLASALQPRELLTDDIHQNQPALRALLNLTMIFRDQLAQLCAEKGLMSFGDVAHSALRALRQKGVADVMRERFRYIFVDEYQDVTDLQQALIDCVKGCGNVFMVGDVKQSIYRFRQAEPGLFIEIHSRFSRGLDGELITLSRNFRSRPSVLAFVNAVFECAMARPSSDIDYDDSAHLYPGAQFEHEDPPIELLVVSRDPGQDEERDEPDGEESFAALDEAEREALLIAGRIRAIHDGEQLYDAKLGNLRPYTYRDFAVMIRNRNGMSAIERVLTEAGIPVYADMNKGYLDAIEVQVARALLQIIENRRRDVELLAVLRSPIGNLPSQQLAQIRARHMAGSYRDAATDYMDAMDDDISAKLASLEQKLDRWRALSRALPLPLLVDVALRESGYYAHVGRGGNGKQRQSNLDMLITYATEYEKTEGGGLTGFLNYLGEIHRKGDDMGAAHSLGEGDDVVRLMTIHKSKGLEYPVVIGAMLGKPLLRADKIGDISLHRELGCGLALTDMELGSRRKTAPQRAIAERARLEQFNEEVRVLYVLLTRAVDRLILTGSVKSVDKSAQDWQIAGMGGAPKTYLDMLMPLALGEGALTERGQSTTIIGGARVEARIVPAASLGARTLGDEDERPHIVPTDEQMRKALSALSWQYPHGGAVTRPLKLTVSGLVRELTGPNVRPALTRRPKFLSGDGLSNTERGTLTHQALMGLDLAALRGLSGGALRDELRLQLDGMLGRGKLMAPLEPDLVAQFIEGPTGQRLTCADVIHREWPFNLRMSIREAIGDADDESVLVQGVIDCCFLEDGQWILLDYKTDYSHDIDELSAQYRPQLDLYGLALSRITGIAVRQKLLCLLRSGVVVEL